MEIMKDNVIYIKKLQVNYKDFIIKYKKKVIIIIKLSRKLS